MRAIEFCWYSHNKNYAHTHTYTSQYLQWIDYIQNNNIKWLLNADNTVQQQVIVKRLFVHYLDFVYTHTHLHSVSLTTSIYFLYAFFCVIFSEVEKKNNATFFKCATVSKVYASASSRIHWNNNIFGRKYEKANWEMCVRKKENKNCYNWELCGCCQFQMKESTAAAKKNCRHKMPMGACG